VIEEVEAGRLMIDGALVLPAGASPLRERRKLGFAGIVAVAIALDDDGALAAPPAVALFGAPQKDSAGEDVVARLVDAAESGVESLARKKRSDDGAVDIAVERSVRNAVVEFWGKRPIVRVLINRV
jgi:ribonuclease J